MNLFIQIIQKLLSRIIKSVSPEIFQQSCMHLPVYLLNFNFWKNLQDTTSFLPPQSRHTKWMHLSTNLLIQTVRLGSGVSPKKERILDMCMPSN